MEQRFRLRTETARERDVFRHLHPWLAEYRPTNLDRQVFPADDARPLPEPTPCPDTALVAFAQLCTLRLRARRCFVTLISSNVEYVLAEATRTMSLQYDTVEDTKDRAWLGTCSFMRDDGMSSEHMDAWRRAREVRECPSEGDHFYTDGSSPHWHIISDVRSNEVYRRRNFVARSPALRFYAAIPLRGAHGSVLGSLAIVDDIPRYGISAAELSFMEDVADTITQHLDATVVRSQRQRSERMIQGLGLFNNGKSSLRHWWLKQEDARKANIGRHNTRLHLAGERSAAANREFGPKIGSSSDKETSSSPGDFESYEPIKNGSDLPHTITGTSTSLQNVQAESSRDSEHVGNHDFGDKKPTARKVEPPTPLPTGSIKHPPSTSKPSLRPRKGRIAARLKSGTNDDFDLAKASQHTYARASNLMREALGADGVVFVNADAIDSDSRTQGSEQSISGNRHAHHVTSEGDTSDAMSSASRVASVQAFSAADESTARGSQAPTNWFVMAEKFVAMLIKRYPRGHIFNFTEDGAACSSSNEENVTSGSASNSDPSQSKRRRLPRDGKRLKEIMTDARTIAFFPIWDEGNDRYCSCAFVWCASPLRYFDSVEDITYLASWGQSIVAELTRLETIAADKAKGAFISSVSHELRSPLHGVLAGVEFLEDTELTSFQQEMAHTISIAGRTLLDTVDHILDHAKMSRFTRAQREEVDTSQYVKNSASGRKGPVGEEAARTINLAQLTEETVETVVSAHRFQNARRPDTNDLSIITNIPYRENWNTNLSSGGWTRIVQNLVGNALKYTQKGLISIRLGVGDAVFQESEEPKHAHQLWPIRLTVQDTGIGIGKHFLVNSLYTPFKQENSHSNGTGLGLSIVRQICQDMGAQLEITSDVGVGTTATVEFRIPFAPIMPNLENHTAGTVQSLSGTKRELNVEHYHWILPELSPMRDLDQDHHADVDTSTDCVGGSVLETAKEWLKCEVSEGMKFPVGVTSAPWIYAIAENDLSRWIEESPDSLQPQLANIAKASSHVLVLGSNLNSVSSSVLRAELPFTPVFVHQPVGPQKLLRAIISDQSSTLLGSIDNAAGDVCVSDSPRLTDPGSNLKQLLPATYSPHPIGKKPDPEQISIRPSLRRGTSGVTSSLAVAPSSSVADSKSSVVMTYKKRSRAAGSSPSLVSRSTLGSADWRSSDGEDEEERQQRDIMMQKRDKVLLVEDNEVNMKLLVALMRKQSLPYECAMHGREAVDMCSAAPGAFFLILMDMSMPTMDGFTATAKIRKMERKLRLPRSFIAALTGVTSDDARARAFDCGVDEFFSKPVHMKEIKLLATRAREQVEVSD